MYAITVKDDNWSQFDGKVALVHWITNDKTFAEELVRESGRFKDSAEIVEVDSVYVLSHAPLYDIALTKKEAEILAEDYKAHGYSPSIGLITNPSDRWDMSRWDKKF